MARARTSTKSSGKAQVQAKPRAARAAAKPAPKTTRTKPTATHEKPAKGPLRGVALVERAIAEHRASGGKLGGYGEPGHEPTGLSAEIIDGLRLPGDRPLPASLARFLAYDATSWACSRETNVRGSARSRFTR